MLNQRQVLVLASVNQQSVSILLSFIHQVENNDKNLLTSDGFFVGLDVGFFVGLDVTPVPHRSAGGKELSLHTLVLIHSI